MLKRGAAFALSLTMVMQSMAGYAADLSEGDIVVAETPQTVEEKPEAAAAEVASNEVPQEEVVQDAIVQEVAVLEEAAQEDMAIAEESNAAYEETSQDYTVEEAENAQEEEAEMPSEETEASDEQESIIVSDVTSGAVIQTAESDDTADDTGSKEGNYVIPTEPYFEKAKVYDFVCDDVKTNPGYQFINFFFGDEADHIYECFITGLKGVKDNLEDIKETAQMIANYFVTNKEEGIGFELTCIDAEKHSADEVEKGTQGTTGYPYGDNELCWAATSSNMLEFAGWNGEFNNEDEIFTSFINGFFDKGSFIEYGLEWYLNGINPAQNATEDGVIFPDYDTEVKNDPAQQRKDEPGRYQPEYYAGNVFQNSEMKSKASDAGELFESLKEGSAVGLSVRLFNEKGEDEGGHAITLFGYIKDTVAAGINGIKALFLADSDNSKGNEDKLVHKDAQDTKGEREKATNSLELHYIEQGKLNGYDTYNLYTYYEGRSYLSDVTVLEAKKSIDGQLQEKDGTKDPIKSPDLVITDFKSDEADSVTHYVGDEISLTVSLENMSYVGFSKDGDATINYTVSIYKGDELLNEEHYEVLAEDIKPLWCGTCPGNLSFNIAGEFELRVKIDSIVDKDGKPIREAYTTNNNSDHVIRCTILDREGEETVPEESPVESPVEGPDETTEVVPEPSPEEITGDLPTFTPTPAPKPETTPAPTQTPAPTKKPAPKPEAKQQEEIIAEDTETCNCYCTRFGFTCDCEECGSIILRKDWLSNSFYEDALNYLIKKVCAPLEITLPVKETETLHVFLDGEFFCKDLYKVVKKEDGSLIIEIDGEIVRKIGARKHKLVIETDEGFIYYHLNIV